MKVRSRGRSELNDLYSSRARTRDPSHSKYSAGRSGPSLHVSLLRCVIPGLAVGVLDGWLARWVAGAANLRPRAAAPLGPGAGAASDRGCCSQLHSRHTARPAHSRQGVDRGQAGVAGGASVPPLLFEVVQELPDERGVQVGEAEGAGRLAGLALGEGEQEPAGVAVGSDRVRAGLLLPGQPVGEEALQDGGQVGHDACRPSCPAGSSLAAARARSSGTAERYQ